MAARSPAAPCTMLRGSGIAPHLCRCRLQPFAGRVEIIESRCLTRRDTGGVMHLPRCELGLPVCLFASGQQQNVPFCKVQCRSVPHGGVGRGARSASETGIGHASGLGRGQTMSGEGMASSLLAHCAADPQSPPAVLDAWALPVAHVFLSVCLLACPNWRVRMTSIAHLKLQSVNLQLDQTHRFVVELLE